MIAAAGAGNVFDVVSAFLGQLGPQVEPQQGAACLGVSGLTEAGSTSTAACCGRCKELTWVSGQLVSQQQAARVSACSASAAAAATAAVGLHAGLRTCTRHELYCKFDCTPGAGFPGTMQYAETHRCWCYVLSPAVLPC
jgi:hypothetical protein